MDPRDARLLLEHARSWGRRGLLRDGALDALERELGADAADATPGVGLSILYALAGALLGAACIAIPVLLHVPDRFVEWWLLGLGLPVLAAGLLVWRLRGSSGIADALLVGSLVPLTIMGLPDAAAGRWLAPLSLLAAIAVAWLPRASTTVPFLGNVATFVAAGIAVHRLLGDGLSHDAGPWIWLAAGLAQLAAVLAFARERPWRMATAALLCIGVVVPFVLGLDHALPSHPTRFYELLVGAFELALLMAGIAVRERGVVLGAAIVVALDAIAYAFETNVVLGIAVLLGVAVALIALAGTLKRLVRRPDAP